MSNMYYVNQQAQATGEHEVHTSVCSFLPKSENRVYLGTFTTCQEAVRQAKQTYSNVDGCAYCAPNCHKK